MTAPTDAGEDGYLGTFASVSFHLVRTDRPWETGIDTIVLSAGRSLGNLGTAVATQFPGAGWSEIPYRELTPDRPVILDLPGKRLRRAVIVTTHAEENFDRQPTLSAIDTATFSAVAVAITHESVTLGVPLLGTGALGMRPDVVADFAIRAVFRAIAGTFGPDTLRRVFFLCLNKKTESAIRAAWRRVASNAAPAVTDNDEPSTDLAGGVSSDLVNPNIGIPLHRDQLGFAPYVSMLATVIADRKTPLPLSIGIFGAWGSGKSYFMGLLRAEVDQLTRSPGPAYCDEIVQIGFNAWHYADRNLWASLGDEIFRQLAGPGPSMPERRARLREELAQRLDQVKELEDAKQQAQLTAARLQADVEKAGSTRENTAKVLIRALAGSKQLWRLLGVRDETEQGALLMAQLHGTLSDVDALRRSPRDRWGRVALTAAAVLLIAGFTIAMLVPAAWQWLTGVVGAGFLALTGTGITFLSRARAGIRALRDLSDDLRSGMDRAANTQLTPEIAEMLDELRQAEAKQRVAEAQLQEVVARVGELGRQLTELTPGRNVYTFLAERARGEDYRSNLGLISTIRKDFEQLVALMDDWRKNPGPDRKPIDRIVLYIDDLDRCSSRQVVAVLEAVHLLLALELFVVVVGVDPRWLVRSLRSHYDAILDHGADGDGWHVTPEDYLEKIINLPLVLPGMSSGSLRGLLRSLVKEGDDRDERTGEPAATDRRAAEATSSSSTALEPGMVEAGSEVDLQQRRGHTGKPPRPLTDEEINLVSKLDHLVGTPREAKRLFNLYRMLRATRDLSDASRFLGDDGEPGEYQVVVALLGLLTAPAHILAKAFDAEPDPARSVGGGLARRPQHATWTEFVADCEPRRDGNVWHNRVTGTIPERDAPHWLRLHQGLTAMSEDVHVSAMSQFQRWVPRIRRFSYVLSPSG